MVKSNTPATIEGLLEKKQKEQRRLENWLPVKTVGAGVIGGAAAWMGNCLNLGLTLFAKISDHFREKGIPFEDGVIHASQSEILQITQEQFTKSPEVQKLLARAPLVVGAGALIGVGAATLLHTQQAKTIDKHLDALKEASTKHAPWAEERETSSTKSTRGLV